MGNNIIKKIVKEEIQKKLQEIKQFDPEEFETSAKQAAKQDIEGAGEEFQDIGQSKYEKDLDAEDFIKDLERADLKLPEDEKELEKIQKALDKRKKEIASMKGASLNENKKK